MKEMWDQRYSGEEYYYGILPNLFFKEKLEGLHPGRLFLPAEGEGRNAVFAAGLGWQVTAMDFSSQAKDKALKLAASRGVSIGYLIADLAGADPGNEVYDAAGLIYLHMDPGYRQLVHRKIMNSIKPGGYIILEAFNKNQVNNSSGGPKMPDMLFSIKMLEEDFAGLDFELLEESDIYLEQGDGHQGKASVIRMLARKIA
jgi:hypothetical protein